jgi:enamine deaminase RidA (YjgF/YER057c/UK114 family)
LTISRISSGSKFEDLAAYSRAVIDGDYVHISGTVGADPATGAIPEDAGEQARNIFRIVEPVLARAGATLAQVVRTRVYLTDAGELLPVAAVLREKFDACRPTNTTLIVGIPAPGAKVEMEFTARLGAE